MIFSKDEMRKRIRLNYGMLKGEKKSISGVIVECNDRAIGEKYFFNISADSYDPEIKFISGSESSISINRRTIKEGTKSCSFKVTTAGYTYIDSDTIIEKNIGWGNKIECSEFKTNTSKRFLQNIFYLYIVFTDVNGPISVRVYDDYNKDHILDLYDDNALYNNLLEKVYYNKIIKEIDNTVINIMDPVTKYMSVATQIPPERVIKDEDGNITKYINAKSKVESINTLSKEESLHYVSINNCPIYSLSRKFDKNGNITCVDYMYSYNTDYITNNQSYYLSNNCKSLNKLPDEIEEKFIELTNIIGDDMHMKDASTDPDYDDIINIYKDNTENIYTIIVRTDSAIDTKGNKQYITDTLFRIIDNTLGIIYYRSGNIVRTIGLSFEDDDFAIDSTTTIGRDINNFRDTTISMDFDTSDIKFKMKNTIDPNGNKKRIYYHDIELEIGINYNEDGSIKSIDTFNSSIYNRYIDKYVYIRDEYGAYEKLNIV